MSRPPSLPYPIYTSADRPPPPSLPSFPQMFPPPSLPHSPSRFIERERYESHHASQTASPDELIDDDEPEPSASTGRRLPGVKLEHGTPMSGGEKKPATRRRVVQSCSECRRRKIKCDKKFPCGPCILRSDQAKCHEVGMAEKHVVASPSHYATTAELATVAHRLDALEAALVKTGALIPADLDHYLKTIRATVAGVEEPENRYQEENRTSAERDDTEDAALTLEHLAFGRSRMEGTHSIAHFGSTHSSAAAKVPNNDYHLHRGSTHHLPSPGQMQPGQGGSPLSQINKRLSLEGGRVTPVQPSSAPPITEEERSQHIERLLDLIGPGVDPTDFFWKSTHLGIRYLARILPDPARGKILIENASLSMLYLQKVEWIHRCIHIPTFLRQCNDLWAMDTNTIMEEIALPWIALYITTLLLGLQFMDSSEIAKHFTPEEAQTLPTTYYNAFRAAMYGSDFAGSPTVEHIQAYVLASVIMNNRDRADAAWAYLGACIKMAQSLGMSRLGAEQQAVEGKPLPMWTGRWESVIQREVGRRVWWNLVFLDWALAPSYNYTCAIAPDQIKTSLPSNIEDEDIIDGQPLKPKPLSVRTAMSFQLARLKFAEISHRQIWQANNTPHSPYSFVLQVDGELRKAMMELPAFFKPESDKGLPSDGDSKGMVQYYEKVMLNLAVHSRMLRLHRPWLSKGYEDEKFSYSKEQCIRAARATLRLMSDDAGVASFLEKWWIPLFYVSVAGMVVIIDLLRTAKKDMHSKETEAKIAEVKGSLDQMRQISDISHPSRATVKVMDSLMAEVEDRRRPSTLGKRKTPASPHGDLDTEEPGLQHAVKKLIRQAALEMDSDASQSAAGSTPGEVPRAAGSISPFSQPASRDKLPTDVPPLVPQNSGPSISQSASTSGPGAVFDAYPIPGRGPSGSISQQPIMANGFGVTPTPTSATSTQSGNPLTAPAGQFSGSGGFQNGAAGQLGTWAQNPQGFTFPIDPSNPGIAYPPVQPSYTNQPQPLDPALEQMLSFLPSVQGQPTGTENPTPFPDDFLSKVFSFTWDGANGNSTNNNNTNSNNSGGVDAGQAQQGQGQGQQGQGQGMAQGGMGNGQLGLPGQPTWDGWHHGWMA